MRRRRKSRYKCFWCNRTMAHRSQNSSLAETKDHVIPKAMGGTETVPCCKACNSVKGDRSPDEWATFMKENPEWWRLYRPRKRRGPARQGHETKR